MDLGDMGLALLLAFSLGAMFGYVLAIWIQVRELGGK